MTQRNTITDTQKAGGILPAHKIAQMIRDQQILAEGGIADDQIQPASLDVRLGDTAYRLRASFLPGAEARVLEKLADLTYHEIDLTQAAVLETGCVYLVPLQERLALPTQSAGFANPKSSTGRIDVFTRLITDNSIAFDTVGAGYKGALYLEISPRTFPIVARAGSRLAQLRFRQIGASAPAQTHKEISVDLRGAQPNDTPAPIGYRAKPHAGLVDIDREAYLDALDYWEPIFPDAGGRLVLDPDAFYILASREAVSVPANQAAEMVPFDPLFGEFRAHYAGFFDPGFGVKQAGGAGSRAVLEVRSRDVPFILEHGQLIARLVYEPLTARPKMLYGETIGAHYQAQGLRLSKHFRPNIFGKTDARTS